MVGAGFVVRKIDGKVSLLKLDPSESNQKEHTKRQIAIV